MARRVCRRRLRADLLWAFVAFALLQVGLAWAVERWLPDVRDPEAALKEERLRARRAEAPDHALVLMLGSSRAAMALRAAELSASLAPDHILVLNGAVMGGGPMKTLICLRRALDAGLRPDLLFVEVVPMHFHQPAGLGLEERTLSGATLTTAEIAAVRPYCDEPVRQRNQWLKSRLVPCVGYRAQLHDYLALDVCAEDDDLGLMDSHGWHPRHWSVTPTQHARHTEQALRQYDWLRGPFRPTRSAVRALSDVLECCRVKGIAVALIAMPESKAFQALYEPTLRADINAFLGDFSAARGVPLIDARSWLSDDDFWDGHHMLPEGAGHFSIRFENEALRPYYPLKHGVAAVRSKPLGVADAKPGGRRDE